MYNESEVKIKKKLKKVLFSRIIILSLFVIIQLLFLQITTIFLKEYLNFIYALIVFFSFLLLLYIINTYQIDDFKLTWCLLILLTPVFSSLFYIYMKFDIGPRKLSKSLKHIHYKEQANILQDKETFNDLKTYSPYISNLSCYLYKSVGFPVYYASDIKYFPLGEDYFTYLFSKIEKAEKYIFLEYFIIDYGKIWTKLLNLLKEKVKVGVEVRLLYDGTNALCFPDEYIKELNSYGIKTKVFYPLKPLVTSTQNTRDHRKICIIDGKYAFTGGINIADEYANLKKVYGHWKDTGVCIKGNAIKSFLLMFLEMWNVNEKNIDSFEKYGKYIVETEKSSSFIIPYGDSPYDNEDVGKSVYSHILSHSFKYVNIMTPYLILDSGFINQLIYSAKSGTEVNIIMPGIPDKWYAFALAKTYYNKLLEAGVNIYEYKKGFVHSKVILGDDIFSSVGTVNLDYRSFYHHFECGVYIYNHKVLLDIKKDFQNTLEMCEKVTILSNKKRGIIMKICGYLLRIVAPFL